MLDRSLRTTVRSLWLRRVLTLLAGASVVLILLASWQLDWWKQILQPSPDFFIFRDSFEDARTLNDLMPLDGSRWHGAQQESGGSVEITTAKFHSGASALKCFANPRTADGFPKADIERSGLRFVRGEHVYFRGWYYLTGDSGDDRSTLFLWDLETTGKHNSPGRRLYLQSGGLLASDLGKWWTGKTIRQERSGGLPFPKDQWVCVRVHLFLSNNSAEGILETWQNDIKVLDAHCQTLPTAATIFDRLQAGITAQGSDQKAVTLFVDDVEISNRPLWN